MSNELEKYPSKLKIHNLEFSALKIIKGCTNLLDSAYMGYFQICLLLKYSKNNY